MKNEVDVLVENFWYWRDVQEKRVSFFEDGEGVTTV